MRQFLKRLGPGLIMAAAAIGVSHLVQSTRAGAEFGYALVALIIMTNLLKYPFFEAGHRYTIATNESLVRGYRRLGRFYCLLFLILSLIASFGSVAAVSFVTSAILQYLIPLSIPIWGAALVVFGGCGLVLWWGRYTLLDRFIKLLMAVLLISTVGCLLIAFFSDLSASEATAKASPWHLDHLAFLIALMGWMPAPIELSAWQSLWILAKNSSDGRRMTTREGEIDFKIGYGVTLVTALLFLLMGAWMLPTGPQLEATPLGFVEQLIRAYSQNLGEWSAPLVAIAAFACMFSTSLTLIDAYPRSITDALSELMAGGLSSWGRQRIYLSTLTIILLSAFFLIVKFSDELKGMVDFVTILAFLAAPVFAFLNMRLLRSAATPFGAQPGWFLRRWSEIGLLFLISFALLFLWKLIF